MLRLRIHLADSKEGQRQTGCCPTGSPLAGAVHELYRKLGLCECAPIEPKA